MSGHGLTRSAPVAQVPARLALPAPAVGRNCNPFPADLPAVPFPVMSDTESEDAEETRRLGVESATPGTAAARVSRPGAEGGVAPRCSSGPTPMEALNERELFGPTLLEELLEKSPAEEAVSETDAQIAERVRQSLDMDFESGPRPPPGSASTSVDTQNADPSKEREEAKQKPEPRSIPGDRFYEKRPCRLALTGLPEAEAPKVDDNPRRERRRRLPKRPSIGGTSTIPAEASEAEEAFDDPPVLGGLAGLAGSGSGAGGRVLARSCSGCPDCGGLDCGGAGGKCWCCGGRVPAAAKCVRLDCGKCRRAAMLRGFGPQLLQVREQEQEGSEDTQSADSAESETGKELHNKPNGCLTCGFAPLPLHRQLCGKFGCENMAGRPGLGLQQDAPGERRRFAEVAAEDAKESKRRFEEVRRGIFLKPPEHYSDVNFTLMATATDLSKLSYFSLYYRLRGSTQMLNVRGGVPGLADRREPLDVLRARSLGPVAAPGGRAPALAATPRAPARATTPMNSMKTSMKVKKATKSSSMKTMKAITSMKKAITSMKAKKAAKKTSMKAKPSMKSSMKSKSKSSMKTMRAKVVHRLRSAWYKVSVNPPTPVVTSKSQSSYPRLH